MPNHDPLPICIDCHRRMQCIKNGVIVMQQDENREPMYFQHADMYECNSCGHRTVSGFSVGFYTRNQTDSFNEEKERWLAQPEEFQIWWR